MGGPASLLERLQGLLERTYGMTTGPLDVARFVIGDAGYREIYGGDAPPGSLGSASGQGARTMIRETRDGLRACIYYPDELIRRLEDHPPHRAVSEHNVDAFATLVEELDHLLCIADRAATDRSLSLFELELHANVSKYLVLARFIAGRRPALTGEKRTWLRFHLFEKLRFCDEDALVRARYRDAARWAVRFLDALRDIEPAPGVEALRRFHAETASGKLQLIDRLAA